MPSKKAILHLAPVLAVLTLPLLIAQAISQSAAPAAAPARQSAPKKAAAHEDGDEGNRIFEQNCSRCHNAPTGFSPRISGTVIRHMRVRASLSKHDEEALLHFLNP